jgi:hypothetical protein
MQLILADQQQVSTNAFQQKVTATPWLARSYIEFD